MASPVKRPHSAPPTNTFNLSCIKKNLECAECASIIHKKAFVEIFHCDEVDKVSWICSPECYKKFTKVTTWTIHSSKVQNLVKDNVAKK